MAIFIDRKHTLLISSRLRNFKATNTDLFNFSCPLCGDSRKDKLKARGYIYARADKYHYKCHNCNAAMPFGKFLREFDPEQYKAYLLETFGEPALHKHAAREKQTNRPDPVIVRVNMRKLLRTVRLPTIAELPVSSPAQQYIARRRIPVSAWRDIYYAEDFKAFCDETIPDHGKNLREDEPRIVLPYRDRAGNLTGFAGRDCAPDSSMRYITMKITDDAKFFNLDRVDFSRTVYVFEGQFDSLFARNAVASGDSNLARAAQFLQQYADQSRIVIVFDNEPRNDTIALLLRRAINHGFPVVMFPKNIAGKDLNQMVIDNEVDPDRIEEFLEENTYRGLEAQLRYAEWKL